MDTRRRARTRYRARPCKLDLLNGQVILLRREHVLKHEGSTELVPGMHHCSGGPGPNTFDMLPALEDWVERGVSPSRIVASHLTNGAVDRTRPLCPHPQVARYSGSGSIDDAANFRCEVPQSR